MAQRYFPNGDAIGRSVKLPDVEDRPPASLSVPKLAGSWLSIIGVVADSRDDGLRNPVRPAIYIPYTLDMSMGTQILIRSRVPPLTLAHAVRQQVSGVNPDQQIYGEMDDLETWIADEPEWQQEHLVSWIYSGFAGLALLLAAVGLFSVVSYAVAQRTNEFGIRMALGAPRRHVLQIVFASTMASLFGGILIGTALVFAFNKMIGRWVSDNAHDPIVLLASIVTLVVVAGIACTLPALRASWVDPMKALRCE